MSVINTTLLITNITTLFCLLIVTIYYKIPNKIFRKIIEPQYSRQKFIKMVNKKIGEGVTLLDVGCGNNSPFYLKREFPNIKYTGIDIGDYNQTMPNLADDYIITSPENFAIKIKQLENSFNVVISSHNLEHCNDRNATLIAMANALKGGGYLYLSFPTEKSVDFPGPRINTLNYYDDFTHKETPPNFDETLQILMDNGIEIIFSSKSYKPFFMSLIGALNERKSRKDKEIKNGTWAYWGFEAIIWGRKTP
jgi:ubiquinone/menaquinone biosynthesis C-methylase UbiE